MSDLHVLFNRTRQDKMEQNKNMNICKSNVRISRIKLLNLTYFLQYICDHYITNEYCSIIYCTNIINKLYTTMNEITWNITSGRLLNLYSTILSRQQIILIYRIIIENVKY